MYSTFNLNLDLPIWVSYSDLSEDDKIKYPISEQMGGYLLGGVRKKLSQEEKIQLYKESAKKSWESTTQEDRDLTFKLPNFDVDVFFEIFGIDVRSPIVKEPDLTNLTTEELIKEICRRGKL